MDEPEVPNSHFVEEFVSEEGKNVLLLNKKLSYYLNGLVFLSVVRKLMYKKVT